MSVWRALRTRCRQTHLNRLLGGQIDALEELEALGLVRLGVLLVGSLEDGLVSLPATRTRQH